VKDVEPLARGPFTVARYHISGVLEWMSFFGAANIISQCGSLMVSMLSLIGNVNAIPPIVVAVVEVVGIGILAVSRLSRAPHIGG
jgi:hypothetical protein